MARGNQTFQKRQRENKLRERAQQKRERRQQRQAEKKQAHALGNPQISEQLVPLEQGVDSSELGAGHAAGDGNDIAPTAETDEAPGGWTSSPADHPGSPQNGGIMASRLFVGNLPRGITESALAEFVTNGGFQVTSAVVIRDRMTGDPKGFGFVDLAEGEDLQRAIQGLDGQMLDDNRLSVNEARPQRTGFSGPRGGGGGGRSRGGFGGGGGRGRGGFGGRGRGY